MSTTLNLVSETQLEARIGVPGGIAPLDVVTGAVPAQYLAATGTPDGTKFLRDDNSWQPMTGGAHPDLATHDAMGLAVDAHNHDASYAPTHAHPYEASGAVSTHAGLSDPHPTYLTSAEGNAAYEASGAVTAHAGAANPHSVYATDTDLTTHAATPHGGAGTWTTVIKTADESKNSLAVVADDALLKFTTLPNTNYAIRLRAFFLTNATADLKYRLVHGGTTTRVRRSIVRTATGDVAAHITTGVAFDVADVILSTTGLNPTLYEEVILQVGAAGGLFVLRWSQVTSNAGPTTCLEGSLLEYALT